VQPSLIWAGTLRSKYGDVIAEKTGLGRVWMGAILIAGITSLPELASGVSAVAWLNANQQSKEILCLLART
jgi:cation:H+ antiporter